MASSRRPGSTRLAPLLAAILAACGGGGGGGDGGGGNTPPPTGAGTVTGAVIELATGGPVAGATVEGGGRTAISGDDGQFTLSGLAAGDVTLTVEKGGYAPAYALARAGTGPEVALVTMKREGARQPYARGSGATLVQTTEAGPYALVLAPDTLDTTDTNLTVSVTPLDPTREADALPGELVTSGASPSLLLPVTFAEFSVYDSAGERLNLRAGASAIVEMPIPAALRETYPLGGTIHCYAFSPASGAWEDFVEGTVAVSSVDGATPVLRASIRHFSWYGGAPQTDDCVDVYGKVVSAVDGRPLGNARVEAFPGTSAYTDADGNFTVVAAPDAGGADFVAYQTGFDVDGSLTGLPGAKYIEFGRVEDDLLVGLVRRSCSGASGGLAGAFRPAVAGTPEDRLLVRTRVIEAQEVHDVVAVLAGSGATLFVNRGTVAPDGTLLDEAPVDVAVARLLGPGAPEPLALLAPGTGVYATAGTAALVPGAPYTLELDVHGDGVVDARARIFALGEPSWVAPADGATVPAASLVLEWTDSALAAAAPGYAPTYWVTGSSAADAFVYLGTGRTLAPTSLTGTGPLTPGLYTATLSAWSGPAFGTDGMVQNIAGVGIRGIFYAIAPAPQEITFTVQ